MRGYGKQLYVAGMCVVSMAGVCGTSVGAPPAGAAHVHPTEGPHHGALIELGKEEYHAELVHDDRAGFVTIYILDGAAKTAVPIQAKEVTLNLLVGGKPRQFRLAALAQPGDVIVAGRRFAHGSQHSHPFLAMKEMGLGLLVVKPTRAPFRLAIYMGVPLLEISEAAHAALADGDVLDIDFTSGRIVRTGDGHDFSAPPLPAFLLDIVRAGGGIGYMREQAAANLAT